jgi:hypothetical protein
MGAFDRKYSRELEEAVRRAACDRGIQPARRILELAQAGELEDGLPAEPVTIDMVRHWIGEEKRARAGRKPSAVASMPARDAVELLRRRLLTASEEMLRRQENKSPDKRDPEMLRQIARAVREAAAIPGPTDPRPSKPGQRDPRTGEHNGTHTTGGLAAQIAATANRSETAPKTSPTHTERETEALGALVETGSQHIYGEGGLVPDTHGLPGERAEQRV